MPQGTTLELDSDISVGIYLSFFTGLRIGELCALQWGDIDFESGLLRVRKTMRIYVHTSLDRKLACMNLLAPLA